MSQHIIKRPWPTPGTQSLKVRLPVDRQTLAKRRWQGVAEDGTNFGFDLETPISDGTVFFENGSTQYLLAQKPEPLLKVSLGDPAEAALTAWSLGNLHFPIEVERDTIQVVDDSAVRVYLERNHVPFQMVTAVFRPLKTVSHDHAHGHAH
jgi:urease accessory protein